MVTIYNSRRSRLILPMSNTRDVTQSARRRHERDAPDPFAVSITQTAFWDYTCDLRDIADNSTYLPFCSLAFPKASHQVPKSI